MRYFYFVSFSYVDKSGITRCGMNTEICINKVLNCKDHIMETKEFIEKELRTNGIGDQVVIINFILLKKGKK